MNNSHYTLKDYLHKKTFASFLPGIAGTHGVPLWSFYVNRGQGITSFGIENKNKSIMEFFPANKAFERVSSHGFRTFIKVDGTVYEPFTLNSTSDSIQNMYLDFNVLHLEDINNIHKIKVQVSYFILPNHSFGALVRKVSVYNLAEERSIEIIDGMPEVLPSGIDTETIKNMSYTARAWADVFYTDKASPLYKTRSSIGDKETVEEVQEGVFFINTFRGKLNHQLIIDRDLVFEYSDNLAIPMGFQQKSIAQLMKCTQYSENKYSSAFACIADTLQKAGQPKDSLQFVSYFGYVNDSNELEKVRTYLASQTTAIASQQAPKAHSQLSFIDTQMQAAEQLITDLTNNIATQTAFTNFDNYCRQSYLDNVLRGGYPLIFNTKHNNLVYHVYSRKHGDLERDYNYFNLEARYYSQGNGNFRDVCQNRRNDVLFNPQVGDYSVRAFIGFLQADGYNPLVVEGIRLTLDAKAINELEGKITELAKNNAVYKKLMSNKATLETNLQEFLQNFTLGDLSEKLKQYNIIERADQEHIIETIVLYAQYHNKAVFGEGFWIDHFSYVLDLIENYLDIFPDNEHKLLFDTELSYYHSPAVVKPRSEKYVVLTEHEKQFVAQRAAVKEIELEYASIPANVQSAATAQNSNLAAIAQSSAATQTPQLSSTPPKILKHLLKDQHGNIYYGTVFEKLFCLVSNKISTLDPSGLGIEMEANKPGWNDALNGMPGILGSGTSEVFETLRIVDFLIMAIDKVIKTLPADIRLNARIYKFSKELAQVINTQTSEHHRWDLCTSLREAYRYDTSVIMPAEKISITQSEVKSVLTRYKAQLEQAIKNISKLNSVIPPSFIEHKATKFELVSSVGSDGLVPATGNASAYSNSASTHPTTPTVKIHEFTARPLPLFLEAAAKSMYVKNTAEARALYRNIKKSNMYDTKLKMYKTSESLAQESHNIGRAKAFTPGWLENESIFMHMEFKYLLKLLEKELYAEYYQEIATILPCFMDVEIYGRPILEASSFIVSSINKNKDLHGRGFSARLSGANAEILSMWKLMFFGKNLFSYENNTLLFTLSPKLAANFFDQNGIITTTLFSKIKIIITNPKKQDTFTIKPQRIICDGTAVNGNVISGSLAQQIRDCKVTQVEVQF